MLENSKPAENSGDCQWSSRAVTVKKVATAKLPTRYGDFIRLRS